MFRSRSRRAAVAAATVLSLLIGGCATSEETQGTAIGAGAGAIIGGLLGAAVAGDGNKTEGALIGAAIGAGAGGLAGNAWGKSVAEKKARYRNERDFLSAEVSEARAKRQAAEAQNRRLEAEIAQLKQQRDTYAAQTTAISTKRAELTRTITAADKDLTDEIAKREEAARQSGASRGSTELAALNDEIQKLKQQRKSLQERRDELAKIG